MPGSLAPRSPETIAKLRDHGGRPRLPIAERFWSKVDRSGGPEACWIWTRQRLRGTYGLLTSIHADGRQRLRAHRVSWELHNGLIPEGQSVLHRCDNPPCVNPAHLRLGSNSENSLERHAKGRTRPRGADARPRRIRVHSREIALKASLAARAVHQK